MVCSGLIHGQNGVLHPIALVIGSEGTVEVTDVVKRLAQCKTIANSGVVAQPLTLAVNPLQQREMRIILGIGLK